jgi:hypothetical protein
VRAIHFATVLAWLSVVPNAWAQVETAGLQSPPAANALSLTRIGLWPILVFALLAVLLGLNARVTFPQPGLFAKRMTAALGALALAFMCGALVMIGFWLGHRDMTEQVRARLPNVVVSTGFLGLPSATFDDVLNLALLVGVVLFLVLFAIDRREEPLGVESHWGGLGDGLSGRRVSLSLIQLAVAFVLLGILVTRTPVGRTLLELIRTQAPATQGAPAAGAGGSGSGGGGAPTQNPNAPAGQQAPDAQNKPAAGTATPPQNNAPVPPPPKN